MANAFLLTEIKNLVDPAGGPYQVVSVSDVLHGITVDFNVTIGEVDVTIPGADGDTKLFLNDVARDGSTKKWAPN